MMAKMKFYWNGTLVRTSESHEYTHAVIDTKTGRVIGCRSSLAAAISLKSSEISGHQKGVEYDLAAILAKQNGKTYIMVKGGRGYTYKWSLKGETVESLRADIEFHERRISYVESNWNVVELERR